MLINFGKERVGIESSAVDLEASQTSGTKAQRIEGRKPASELIKFGPKAVPAYF